MLVWDAPNMDMCLAEAIGAKATAATRPRMDALAAWFADRGDPGDRLEACVFANVGSGQEGPLARWVANLRTWGWAVFVKPKHRRNDDIDSEMIRHIERRFRQGSLVEVIVASHDAKAFGPLLQHLSARDVAVTVLGFREREFLASAHAEIGFIDAEDVPGLFPVALPRTNLYDLPNGGRWFDPFTELAPAARAGAQRSTPPAREPATEPAPGDDAPSDPPAAEAVEPVEAVDAVTDATVPAIAAAPPGDADPPDDADPPGDTAPATPGPDTIDAAQPAPAPDGPTAASAPDREPPTVVADAVEARRTPPPTAPVATRPLHGDAAVQPVAGRAAAESPNGTRPTREGVVQLVAGAVAGAGSGGVSLQEVGDLLRTAFPGFSLESAGYQSVGELLESLQADAGVIVARSAGGHVLLPAPTTTDPDAPDAPEHAALLTDTEPTDTAPADTAPTDTEPTDTSTTAGDGDPAPSASAVIEPPDARQDPEPAIDLTADDVAGDGRPAEGDGTGIGPSFDEFRPRDAVVVDLSGHRPEASPSPAPAGPPTPAATAEPVAPAPTGPTGPFSTGSSGRPTTTPGMLPTFGANPIYRLFGFDPHRPR
ncbi:MAG: hypothetical protein R2755_16355 [Acidimicrobiales bacterium]